MRDVLRLFDIPRRVISPATGIGQLITFMCLFGGEREGVWLGSIVRETTMDVPLADTQNVLCTYRCLPPQRNTLEHSIVATCMEPEFKVAFVLSSCLGD